MTQYQDLTISKEENDTMNSDYMDLTISVCPSAIPWRAKWAAMTAAADLLNAAVELRRRNDLVTTV